jgi:hypothetical protein
LACGHLRAPSQGMVLARAELWSSCFSGAGSQMRESRKRRNFIVYLRKKRGFSRLAATGRDLPRYGVRRTWTVPDDPREGGYPLSCTPMWAGERQRRSALAFYKTPALANRVWKRPALTRGLPLSGYAVAHRLSYPQRLRAYSRLSPCGLAPSWLHSPASGFTDCLPFIRPRHRGRESQLLPRMGGECHRSPITRNGILFLHQGDQLWRRRGSSPRRPACFQPCTYPRFTSACVGPSLRLSWIDPEPDFCLSPGSRMPGFLWPPLGRRPVGGGVIDGGLKLTTAFTSCSVAPNEGKEHPG